MTLESGQETVEFPPKPVEPDPRECCGRGCDPCIYDYYDKALKKWQEKVKTIKRELESTHR